MTYLADIADWSIVALALLLFIVQWLSYEAGGWFGRRYAARNESPPEGIGVVVGGLLGLLAFVLALTLSYANNRFAERRAGTLTEANAISTAWLRAEVVGHPRGDEIARLLEDYTKLRMEFVQAGRNRAEIDRLNQATNALQSRIGGHLAAIVRDQPNTVSTSLMASLNDAFDAATAERFAYSFRLPPQIFWLLIGMSVLAAAALGYQIGVRRQQLRVLVAALFIMWTIVTVDILDLASSRVGAFRTNADVYRWTLQSFKGGIQIPPQGQGR